MVLAGVVRDVSVTIEAHLGVTGVGETWAAPVTTRANVQERSRVIRRPGGQEIVASTTLLLDPAVACPEKSRVTIPTRTDPLTVHEVRRHRRVGATMHLEVLCGAG